MKSLVETEEVVEEAVVAVSLVVLEVSSTMGEEAAGEGTAPLLALAADRPTTGRPTTGVVVDQGTASRDKR